MKGKGLTEAHLKASVMEYTILSPNVFMSSMPSMCEVPCSVQRA